MHRRTSPRSAHDRHHRRAGRVRAGQRPADVLAQPRQRRHAAGRRARRRSVWRDTWSAASLERLAERRRVVAVELQGHGRTADIDRPFSFEAFGDDLAALVRAPGPGPGCDLLGLLPGRRRRPCAPPSSTRTCCAGWSSWPCRAAATAGSPRSAPAWTRSAGPASPMMRHDADVLRLRGGRARRRGVPGADGQDRATCCAGPTTGPTRSAALTVPTLLVYADADSVPPAHAASSSRCWAAACATPAGTAPGGRPARLAVLPGRTHYDVFAAPSSPPSSPAS